MGKHGIVKDRSVHGEVIRKVIEYGEEYGLQAEGLTWSPIKGAKGNIEYLLLLKKGSAIIKKTIEEQKVVNMAFDFFSGTENPA